MDASIDFSGVLRGSIADGGGGDEVIITPVVTSGTKIADVSVNGVEKDLYCPTPPAPTEVDITPVVTSGTKIADVSIGGVEKDLYAPDYETDIAALDGRLDTAEGNITSLTGRVRTAEGNITSLTGRVGTAEGNITEIKQSLSQLDGLAVYRQVIPTGDTAGFIANDSMQIIKLESNIIPSQDLHGYNEPWAGGAGKNKLEVTATSQTINGVTFTVNDDGTIKVNGTATADAKFVIGEYILKAGSSVRLNGSPVDGNTSTIALGYQGYGIVSTANSDRVCDRTSQSTDWDNDVYIGVKSGYTANNLIFKPMIRLATVSDSTFAPYSNICPISGFTDIDVSLSPTLDSQDATIYTTNFVDSGSPLTVYGGYIDVISGLLTVTDANIASYAGETLPSTWISDRDVYTSGGNPTTGAQVVYKLTSALNYQLTAQQINDLVGQNYIWADTGSIKEVGYLDILHLS